MTMIFTEETINEIKSVFETYGLPKTVFAMKGFLIGYASNEEVNNWQIAAQRNLGQSKFNLTILAEELVKRIQ